MRQRMTVGWGGVVGRALLVSLAIALAAMLVSVVAHAATAAADSPLPVRTVTGGGVSEAGESAAVQALRERVGRQGYLLREVRWDEVLRQSWAVLEAVGHPERPYVSVLVPLGAKDVPAGGARAQSIGGGTVSPGAGQFGPAGSAGFDAARYGGRNQLVAGPVVRVGDQVTFWSEERNLHVQLTAVAEQSGAVGERIKLHMLGVSMGWEQTPQRLTGTVRGAGSVEMTQ